MTPIGYTATFVSSRFVEIVTHDSREEAESYASGFNACAVANHCAGTDFCHALPGDTSELEFNCHPQQVSLAMVAFKRARIERGDDGQ